jgi:exo-1,4-beta-D-glucosaminidase
LASREKFLPDPQAWPPSATWSYHFGSGEFANLKVMDSAMAAVYAKPQSAADYERISSAMEYDSERAMYEAYSRNKYVSTGVIQWMLNNAWPSMIWHLYDYYLEAGAGYFGTKKACEPVHIQYSYDDRSIVVVNSTYERVAGLHASARVHNVAWKDLYTEEAPVDAGVDSSQIVFTLPESLYTDAERTFFIDLTLTDIASKIVSRNFYWVPGTLTTFDWPKTDYTHTPAARHEDLTALSNLPAAKLVVHAEMIKTARGREVHVQFENPSTALAFQVSAAIRTKTGGLIAPVIWSDNWIEIVPGEKRELTALLPEDAADGPVVEVGSWNAGSQTIAIAVK